MCEERDEREISLVEREQRESKRLTKNAENTINRRAQFLETRNQAEREINK